MTPLSGLLLGANHVIYDAPLEWSVTSGHDSEPIYAAIIWHMYDEARA